MTIPIFLSQEFEQGMNKAKRAANKGPVFITERGSPAYVLMSIALYHDLTVSQQKIADFLAMPGIEDVYPEIQKLRDLARFADFS